MAGPEEILERLKSRGSLPAMPQVLVQLMDLCRQEEVDLRQVSRVVDKDSALTAKVLQLVNSAFIGARAKFTGIEQAIIYLGANTIQNLAISAAVHQVFRKAKSNTLPAINTFWYHSFSSAVLASELTRTTGRANPGEAYLAGLLHDIGKLILWMAYPGKYAIVLRAAQAGRIPGQQLLHLESETLGADHCQAGAWLADFWQLPVFIGDAIRYHHHSEDQLAQAIGLVQCVHLANRMSHESDLEGAAQTAALFFGLNGGTLQAVRDNSAQQVEAVAQELGIALPQEANSGAIGKEEESGAARDGEALKDRVKDMVFLAGSVSSLLRAENPGQLVTTIAQSMQILFHDATCFVLLHDPQNDHLYGDIPSAHVLQQEVAAIRFSPASHPDCLPVQALVSRSIKNLSLDETGDSICNRQLCNILRTPAMSCVPMLYRNQCLGIIVIGLHDSPAALSPQDKQIQMLACQAAAALYIFRTHEQQARRVVQEQLDTASLVARKVAHEINNPLAILRNYLKILNLKIPDQTSLQEELAIMDQEIQRIGQITHQLSDLGNHTTPSRPILLDLNQAVEETVQLFRLTLEQQKVQLHFHPLLSAEYISADKNKLRQILLNLLGNALDALNGAEGQISVSLEKNTNDTISIAVADSGPGIPDNIQAQIFTPGVTTKGQGHTGLGLCISRKLAGDLGGGISYERNNNTTTFRVSLPT